MPRIGGRRLGATATLYIELPDAREVYERLQGRANIVAALHRTFCGKEEFRVQDVGGYVLCFAGAARGTGDALVTLSAS